MKGARQAWVLTILLLIPGSAHAGVLAYSYEVLALLGTRAPGGGSLRGVFKPAAIGENGEVTYVVGVGSRGAEGLFLDATDGVAVVVQPGADAAKGWRFAEIPGPLGGIASPAGMNAAGDLAFAADLVRGDETGAGVFRWERATGAMSAIALPGVQGPGSTIFGSARPRPAITETGELVFAVETKRPAEPLTDVSEGLFLSSRNQLQPIALPGDAVPGEGVLLRAGRPSANNRGQFAFEADLARGERKSSAILFWEGMQLRTVATDDTEVPGVGRLRQVREPRLNDAGQVAFFGDTGVWGLFLSDPGRLIRLAAPDDSLPFDHRVQSVVTGEGSLALNRQGDIAMVLRLEKPEAAGIFLYHQGALSAVALPGTFLAGVGPFDNAGEYVALSSQGHVAFQAELADGDVALVLATPVPPGG